MDFTKIKQSTNIDQKGFVFLNRLQHIWMVRCSKSSFSWCFFFFNKFTKRSNFHQNSNSKIKDFKKCQFLFKGRNLVLVSFQFPILWTNQKVLSLVFHWGSSQVTINNHYFRFGFFLTSNYLICCVLNWLLRLTIRCNLNIFELWQWIEILILSTLFKLIDARFLTHKW